MTSDASHGAIRVSSAFDSGAIEVIRIDGDRIDLEIRRDSTLDPTCDFRQWFHFRVRGAAHRRLELRFVNAHACTYPGGWDGYRICASVDTERWTRIDTQYDGRTLSAIIADPRDSMYFATFEPYPWQRHLAQLGRALAHPEVRALDLGTTVDGRDLDGLDIGNRSGALVWIIARQHPGETMAEWFVEGLVERLLDDDDALSRALRQSARFLVVPNMNPDGSIRGNLRANAAGANLNREWMQPSPVRSPEVHAVREAIARTGCSLFLDIHGDEALPYVFVAGSEMLPGYTPVQALEQQRFCAAFVLASPDFQTKHGYAAGKYREDALKLASKWVGHTYGCLSLTLEMPFKDNADSPDSRTGWNGARSKALGRAALVAIRAVLAAR